MAADKLLIDPEFKGKATLRIVLAIGGERGSGSNLQTAAEALGLTPDDDVVSLGQIVWDWGKAVHDSFARELSEIRQAVR